MTELVIWAQSVCRSTMALYREVKRQAGVPVSVVMRHSERGDCARQMREAQGQGADGFADVVDIEWDGELESGRGIFVAHSGEGAVHVFSGYQVPPHYDSMLSKLIVHAPTRQEAIAACRRALDEYLIEGIPTTIPF